MLKTWVSISAVLLALAVALGAFGAHVLKGRLPDYYMGVFEKAVFYHLIHALAILILAFSAGNFSSGALPRILCVFLSGILVFSGSLYVLAITQVRWLGAITPLGGLAFIAAWIWLAIVAVRS